MNKQKSEAKDAVKEHKYVSAAVLTFFSTI